jgi:N-acetylglutamate synthase-like GNAT family acetyltransferase
MEVRRARLDDAGEIAELLAELGYPVTEGGMYRRLERLLQRSDHATFVASHDDKVVGVVGAFVNRRYESDAPYGQLLALVVSEGCRRRGIGASLVAAAEQWLREKGVDCVVVHTGLHRASAHEFYAGLDYQATGARLVKRFGPAAD